MKDAGLLQASQGPGQSPKLPTYIEQFSRKLQRTQVRLCPVAEICVTELQQQQRGSIGQRNVESNRSRVSVAGAGKGGGRGKQGR